MTAYFSYRQAMDYMGIKAKSTFSQYVADGLPVILIGNKKRVSKEAIDRFMADHTVVAGKKD